MRNTFIIRWCEVCAYVNNINIKLLPKWSINSIQRMLATIHLGRFYLPCATWKGQCQNIHSVNPRSSDPDEPLPAFTCPPSRIFWDVIRWQRKNTHSETSILFKPVPSPPSSMPAASPSAWSVTNDAATEDVSSEFPEQIGEGLQIIWV